MSKDKCPLLVVPTYDKYTTAREDLTNLLDSIKLGTIDQYCRIVVCLDSCHRIFEQEFKAKYPNYEFLNHTGNPLNFCGNSNRGLRIAREEGVGAFLVNQDTILPSWDFLKTMMEGDMVGASTVEFKDKPLEEVIRLLEETSGADLRTLIPVQELPGWKVPGYCMWYSDKVLQEIGLLPEDYLEASMDDDHMTVLALLAGFKVTKSKVCCYHKGSHLPDTSMSRSGAYGVADGSLQLHLSKFYRKWSIPSNIKHEDAIGWILNNFTWDRGLMAVV